MYLRPLSKILAKHSLAISLAIIFASAVFSSAYTAFYHTDMKIEFALPILFGGVIAVLVKKTYALGQLRLPSRRALLTILASFTAAGAGLLWGAHFLPSPLETTNKAAFELVITATGNRASKSKGREVWFQGARIDGVPVERSSMIIDPSWVERNDQLLSVGRSRGGIMLRGSGASTIDLLFMSHPWSGKVAVTLNGEVTEYDLFSDSARQGNRTIRLYPNGRVAELLAPYNLALVCLFGIFGLIGGYTLSFRRPRFALATAALLIIPVGFTALATAPGLYSPDSHSQLTQATTGKFHTWSPPLMAKVWELLIGLTNAPESLYWFHLVLFAIGLLLWAGVICRVNRGALPIVFLAAAMANPVVLNFAGVLWKDVGLAFALLIATGAVALFWLDRTSAQPNRQLVHWILGAIVILSVVYGTGVRANGLPAALPILAMFSLALLPAGRLSKRKLAIGLALGIVLTGVVWQINKILSENVIQAVSAHPEQYMLLHDLAGIGVQTGNFAFPDAFKAPSYTPDRIIESYRTQSGNFLVFSGSGSLPPLRLATRGTAEDIAALQDLRRAWISQVTRWPLEYIEHRSAILSSLLRIGQRSTPAKMPYTAKAGSGTRFPGDAAAFALLDSAISWTASNTPLFFGWFWALVLLVALAYGWLARKRTPGGLVLMLSLSGLAYLTPYFFVAPASDFRYLYWCILAGSLSGVIMAADALQAAIDFSRGQGHLTSSLSKHASGASWRTFRKLSNCTEAVGG